MEQYFGGVDIDDYDLAFLPSKLDENLLKRKSSVGFNLG